MRKLPITLINIKTGETVTAPSITGFCKAQKMAANDAFHFSPVINKKALIFKGWVLPETYEKLTAKYDWVDIFGNKFEELNVLDIMGKLGIKSFSRQLQRFLSGEEDGFNGLFLKGEAPGFVQNRRVVEDYRLIRGKQEYIGKSRKEVCEQAGISYRSVANLERGLTTSVKGVKIQNLTFKQRSII